MLPFISPTLFNAHALPVDNNEPHALLGNHLRVSHHPGLGLPVAPFLVRRAQVNNFKTLNTRSAAIFYDKNGSTLFPPFDVSPDNPVTARLILGSKEVCIWAQVEALSREDSNGGSQPRPVTVQPGIPTRRPLSTSLDASTPGARVFPTRPDLLDVDFDVPRFPPELLSGKLICEAFIDSALGPASIGTRSQNRYAFSGPGIVEIKIAGTGRVSRIRWIEARDQQPLEYLPYTFLNLPHAGGARYLSVEDAIPMAVNRVEQQAPKRLPLQETVGTPTPAGAPLSSVAFEVDRIKSLGKETPEHLEALINDLMLSPFDQIIEEDIIDQNNVKVGSSSMARLHRIFQMMSDPGTASYLGYKLRDDDWQETEDRMVFYQISGFFRDFPTPDSDEQPSIADTLLDAMIAAVPADNRNLSRVQLADVIAKAASSIPNLELADDGIKALEKHDDYFGVGTVAIADRGAPLDKIAAPRVPAAAHRDWLPATPPEAVRDVQVDVTNVRVAGLLAAGKRTPPTGSSSEYEPLNKKNDEGFHLPLVLSINVDDETAEPIHEPGTGFIGDRQAGPTAIGYFVAQQDRFGRWSNWGKTTAAAGPRPRPPRPQFQAFYKQPAIASASTTGGEILVKVMVPDADALAPGSHLLANLEIQLKHQESGVVTVLLEPESAKAVFDDGDANTFFLLVKHTGPIIPPAATHRMEISAKWIDTVAQKSVQSEIQILKMADPRPPAQLVVPDQLQYAARPDVTGLSWIEHRWTASTNQDSFGIYYTDENRLKAHLDAEDQDAVLTALESASDAAARATIYRSNTALFPDHLFEKLQGVDVSFASGETGFRHAVSGSLRLLNFYKIAAVADSGSKPELLDLPMIVYGIPNSDPPPKPSVIVKPVEPKADENDFVAEVTIEMSPGATIGANWRLRRSSVESANINKMPIVKSGVLLEPDAPGTPQVATTRDDGPVLIADSAVLKPWVQYSWVAEVQGAHESGSVAAGSPVPGRWSRASDPVSLVLVPSAAPAPLVIDAISGTTVTDGLSDVRLALSHPDKLAGGGMGSFKIRLSHRAASDNSLSLVREIEISGEGPFDLNGIKDDEPGQVIALGSEYLIELIDPLGRTSAPTVGAVN